MPVKDVMTLAFPASATIKGVSDEIIDPHRTESGCDLNLTENEGKGVVGTAELQ